MNRGISHCSASFRGCTVRRNAALNNNLDNTLGSVMGCLLFLVGPTLLAWTFIFALLIYERYGGIGKVARLEWVREYRFSSIHS